MQQKKKPNIFHIFAKRASELVGHAWAFSLALASILIWLMLGPVFHFSDTWQLVINTTTSLITFLIVFLIQNTQNRDTEELRIKLDELLRAHKLAKNSVIDLDTLSDEQLKTLEEKYKSLSKQSNTSEKNS